MPKSWNSFEHFRWCTMKHIIETIRLIYNEHYSYYRYYILCTNKIPYLIIYRNNLWLSKNILKITEAVNFIDFIYSAHEEHKKSRITLPYDNKEKKELSVQIHIFFPFIVCSQSIGKGDETALNLKIEWRVVKLKVRIRIKNVQFTHPYSYCWNFVFFIIILSQWIKLNSVR